MGPQERPCPYRPIRRSSCTLRSIFFFAWMAWLWIAITIFADIFRRKDIGGGKKTIWVIFVLLVPFLGVLVYLLANHDEMAERNIKQVAANQKAFDDYVRETAGGGGAAGRTG